MGDENAVDHAVRQRRGGYGLRVHLSRKRVDECLQGLDPFSV